jgi:hypothetical protein
MVQTGIERKSLYVNGNYASPTRSRSMQTVIYN